MRNLFIDVETAPAKVYTFSLWQPIIGIDQVIEESRLMCFSAQWYGDKNTKTMFFSEFHDGRDVMLEKLHALLDEADVVTTYNGKRFDVPWIKGELISEGFTPPSPFKQIDLFQVVKSNMRNISNKLDWVSQKLLGDRKTTHTGFKLWRDCLDGDEKAWALMKKYNIQDTRLMIPLYDVLKAWIPNHPSVAVYDNRPAACPTCGGTNIQSRGVARTSTATYRRYQCQADGCGAWFRDAKKDADLPSPSFRPVIN